ncbi:TerB N-terminal domain-containing protein [Evansella clarkii]|uniref:TerB N-terminal domain-containing protein n=1 Tax=Evansella clarkii TaxID=79879 RepID=UPI000996DF14|nr:TerB N-terminal domain-containing protein [Evansella clarkii]
MFNRKKKVGYLLALFLGALGAHAFYYGKYLRGAIYAGVSIFINPLIPLMVIIGWIDMIFIRKWHEQLTGDNVPVPRVETSKTTKEVDLPKQPTVNENSQSEKPNQEEKKKKSIFSFYNEEDLILDKYAHLETPKHILDDVKKAINNKEETYSSGGIRYSVSVSHSGQEFIKDSYKYKGRTQNSAREIPFQTYWTTFKDLNDKQLKWYFYWRQQVLNKNYIDVDMSYIILFVYELINYSFNKKAAFNVSMMDTLYKKYVDRHTKLKNYLPAWTADMLYELNEPELAKEWGSPNERVPKLYDVLEEGIALNKVTMNTWKEYFSNQRETAYFSENRTKVYNVFKESMGFLEEIYQDNNQNLLDRWFEIREERNVRYVFRSAVIGREVEAVHEYITKIQPTEVLVQEVNAMIRLSENISRKMNNVNRGIKVNEEVLPIGIKEKMEARFLNNIGTSQSTKTSRKITNERFKDVSPRETTEEKVEGSKIPMPPQEDRDKSPYLTFDESKIENLKRETNELVEVFEEGTDKEVATDTKPEKPSTDENIADLKSNSKLEIHYEDSENEEEVRDFVNQLTNQEAAFLLLFTQNSGRSIEQEKAQKFAKEQSLMLGVFLTELNEKAMEYLEENIVDTEGDNVVFDEEFQSLLNLLEERVIYEN